MVKHVSTSSKLGDRIHGDSPMGLDEVCKLGHASGLSRESSPIGPKHPGVSVACASHSQEVQPDDEGTGRKDKDRRGPGARTAG